MDFIQRRRGMKLFVVLLVTLVLLNSDEIHCGGAAAARKSLSVSNQLTPMNTIHTRNGDIIDCVDINKQPAFNHPLLKNHKIQMKPSFNREEKAAVHSDENMPFKNVKFELQACQQGTVPILRTLRRKQDTGSNLGGIQVPPLIPLVRQVPPLIPLVRHYEVLDTDDGDVHYGVKGIINVNHPLATDDQLSSAQIWVQGGPPQDLNLIEAGWVVHQRFFGDNLTRLYTSWSGIGRDHKGCINYFCHGFVQVDSEVYLGTVLGDGSVYGGDIYVLNTEIALDKKTGSWWLSIHDKQVGYWPKELFSYLANNAAMVGFGAVTGAPANSPSPPMGNGHLPVVVDLKRCGFIARMKVIDADGKENDIQGEKVRVAGDKSPCYGQSFRGYVDHNFEMTTSFGGPGGSCR